VKLAARGVEADLPPGWEGAVTTTAHAKADGRAGSLTMVHLATTAMPADRGDFGSAVVEDLGPDDAFVALVEYGEECAGTELFAAEGLPRRLRPRDLNRRALQRTLDGQAGVQRFFTHAGRPFCLYVVLGRDRDLDPLLDRVHAALDGLRIT
jgi:hypothetical protein